jgi:hypothetical protein
MEEKIKIVDSGMWAIFWALVIFIFLMIGHIEGERNQRIQTGINFDLPLNQICEVKEHLFEKADSTTTFHNFKVKCWIPMEHYLYMSGIRYAL